LRPCRTLGTPLGRPSSTTRSLRHVERAALEIEIAARDREKVSPVLDRLRETHDDFRVARSQDLHLVGLAKDRRRLLAEIKPAQRHRLRVDIHECGGDHELFPPIDVVDAAVTRLNVELLPLAGSTCRLSAPRGAHDHHR
jgi:hypothetical protein